MVQSYHCPHTVFKSRSTTRRKYEQPPNMGIIALKWKADMFNWVNIFQKCIKLPRSQFSNSYKKITYRLLSRTVWHGCAKLNRVETDCFLSKKRSLQSSYRFFSFQNMRLSHFQHLMLKWLCHGCVIHFGTIPKWIPLRRILFIAISVTLLK